TLNDSDAAVTGYQWTRDGVDIAGTTASTYTVTEADETHLLRVVETATDSDGGPPTTSTSAPTAAVSDITLAFTTPAAITGTAQEGQVLSAVNGTLNDSDAAVTGYQWQISPDGASGWTSITGATGPGYTPVEADETKFLRVVETATDNDGGPTTTSTSATVGPVADITPTLSAPVISGIAEEGRTLTVSTAAIPNDSDATVTYQWQADRGSGFVNIASATGTSYTLKWTEENATIRVLATSSDPDGGGTTAASAAT